MGEWNAFGGDRVPIFAVFLDCGCRAILDGEVEAEYECDEHGFQGVDNAYEVPAPSGRGGDDV